MFKLLETSIGPGFLFITHMMSVPCDVSIGPEFLIWVIAKKLFIILINWHMIQSTPYNDSRSPVVSTDGVSPPHRRWPGNPRTLCLYEVDINYVSIICNSYILRWESRDQRTRAGTGLLIINTLVRKVGFEPTRYLYRQILSLLCLPFHHSRI